MKYTKKQYFFLSVCILVALVWASIPETTSEAEKMCFEKIMKNIIGYRTFNKVQFYLFLIGNFLLILLRRQMTIILFLLIESLLLIIVIIKLFVYHCSN